MCRGVVSDALDGDVHRCGAALALHLQSFSRRADGVEVSLLHRSDDTHCERACLLAFLESGEDGLQAGIFHIIVSHDIAFHRLCGVCRDIDDACVVLQRTVVLVCSDAVSPSVVCEAVAVVCHHGECICRHLL